MKLFDYQSDFINNCGRSFARGNKRVIAQLPTGGGKGFVLAEIARRAIDKGGVPCISCHREEIFQQLYKNLRILGVSPSLIAQGEYPMAGAPCYLSMVETFCRRENKGLIEHLGIDFYILDEIHLGNYHKMVKDTKNKVIGFTATPKSTGKPELNEYFDDIVCGPSVKDLIKAGRLLKERTFSVAHDFSKVKMRGQDYDERSLFAEFKKPKLWNGAVESYLKNAHGLQALCYCVNVEHSNATVLQFREHGIRAAHVDGKSDKEDRRAIFDMFRRGDIQVICNVGVATTGTDLPNTECIIQNFATTSLVKHVQTLGRGARVADGMNEFIVIDMGRNYIRHGEFSEDIDWVGIFNDPGKATQKREKRAKRECDNCGSVIRFHLQECPYCSHTITQKELEDKLLFGATVEEVRAYRLKMLPVQLRKPLSELSDSQLREYGRIMGYKPSWYHVVKNKMYRK